MSLKSGHAFCPYYILRSKRKAPCQNRKSLQSDYLLAVVGSLTPVFALGSTRRAKMDNSIEYRYCCCRLSSSIRQVSREKKNIAGNDDMCINCPDKRETKQDSVRANRVFLLFFVVWKSFLALNPRVVGCLEVLTQSRRRSPGREAGCCRFKGKGRRRGFNRRNL